ncbi:MAG: double-strand break repair helicase AddA [Alphaproteobacteria bacterium]
MTHLDPDREQRRAADPRASVWVAASAGSGKTKVLVDRVLTLLLGATPPQRILCLTFTKAAAAEMATRIAERLGRWATVGDTALHADLTRLLGEPPGEDQIPRARRLFAQVLDVAGGMKIETIHAFCQSLLKRFPLEAGVAPHFEVMDDRDSALAMAAARDEVLTRARLEPGNTLAAALAEVTARLHEALFPEMIEELARHRGRLRRMIEHRGGVGPLIAATRALLGVGAGETPAGIVAEACAETSFDGPALRAAAAALAMGSARDGERGATLAAWLATPEERLARFDDYCAAFLAEGKDGRAKVRDTLITKKPAAAAPGAAPALAAEAQRLLAIAERLKAVTVAAATTALLRLGAALVEAYDRHKETRALLDYDDLILAARRLLEADGRTAWVLYKLDGGIDHLMIDEAQDTSPDQWAVVRALTAEFFAGKGARSDALRTVFAVGDRKQSIYSFQGADPDGFERMRRLLSDRVRDVGAGWHDVPLNISFRSTRAVLDAVDAVFTSDAARDGVVLEGEDVRHLAYRQGQAGLVEVWPAVRPRPIDPPPPWRPPVERLAGDSPETRLAGLMARRIQAMIRSGEVLPSRNRAVRPGDIMVLVRRRGGFVEDLVRSLKQLGVPVAGVDRMVLTEQMAVMDLMALGRFLLLPEDDLTLATVLKGPLVGLSEEELFALAHPRQGGLWPELRRHDGDGSAFDRAAPMLSEVLGLADLLPPHELFAHVLGRLGGRRRLVARLGVEAEDAIDEFMALTLRHGAMHTPSLQGFLQWMETGAVEIKRDLDQGGGDQGGGGAVRIMTVHGAKGLQAPIVFLPDTLQAPTRAPKLFWHGEGAEALMLWPPRRDLCDPVSEDLWAAARLAQDREYRRLLYVAMTRAEDRLYVCGWHTNKAPPATCWYTLIRDAVAPLAVEEGDAFLAADPDADGSAVLRLRTPQEAKPEASAVEAHLAPPEAVIPEWAQRPPPPEPSPPRPLAPSRPDGTEPPVRSPFGPDGAAHFRRGHLVHRLLQSLPELAPEERSAAARRYLDRAADDMSPEERSALTAEALAVLAHPEAAPLFAPGSQAEVPVVGLVGDRVVSGQVDRLMVSETTVLIADYKTNRPPPAHEDQVAPLYLRQMAAYRAALEQVYPGRRVRCFLVWTDGPRVMELTRGGHLKIRTGPPGVRVPP